MTKEFEAEDREKIMIEIVDYRESWPAEYRAFAASQRGMPGIAAIHHIGSTSVPGLCAKDIIDIQITVTDLDADLPIEEAGFVPGKPGSDHCPPGVTLEADQLHKRFYKFAQRPANVHVRQQGRFNQRYPLLCRDYLRSHPNAANAYGEIKRQLARHFVDDFEKYYDVKDPVFDLLMAGAEDWAAMTSWSLPPSD